ncbi:MAG: zinc-binding dehydrogenase [Candidatus Rokubacteria bacterium]|nr:zinc-binding dehydrogenase [Candidatus Rokubacteria bacterium]
MTGKVAVYQGPGQPMELREYPLPEVGSEDILVRIRCANICGSDLHIWHGRGPGMPRGRSVSGHEMVGEVFRLGREVKHDCLGQALREGDRIAYAYFVPCGACPACLSGGPGCANRYRFWLGSVDEPPHFRGAYGEYYYLRKGQTLCKVPDELSDAEVSPVNCALSEALYGLDEIGVRLGDAVVIQGAGGLGLYATALARDMGAGQVIVLDKRAERLALAKEFGATHVINVDATSEKDRREQVRHLTRGHGADVVAEFVGVPSVVEEGARLLRQGGRYLWIGNITPGLPSALDPGTVVRGAQTVKGVIVYEPWVLPRAIDFLARRRDTYPFGKIISHAFPFEEINRAFKFADEGGAIRVSLRMGASA